MITPMPAVLTQSVKRRSAVMRSAGISLMLYGGLNIALIGGLSLISSRQAWHGVTDAMAFFTMLLFWISVMGIALWRMEYFQPHNLVLRLIAAKPRKTPRYLVLTMAKMVFALPILIMTALLSMKISFFPPMQLTNAAGEREHARDRIYPLPTISMLAPPRITGHLMSTYA